MTGRELDSVGEEIDDDLTVAALVSKQFSEVKLVQWVLKDRTYEVDFFEHALGLESQEALLYKFDAVEVVVHHRKGVVVQLSMVHQVTHKRHHHLHLTLHILALLLDADSLLHVTFDELDEEKTLVDQNYDQVA